MPELVLQLKDIDEVGKDYTFELKPAWLDEILAGSPIRRDPKAESGRLELHAQKNGFEVLVDGEARADFLVECSRCLADTSLHVQANITALLSQADEHGHPREIDADALEEDRIGFVGHEIVLDELVREHLLLECPMQPLCSADCPGIAVPEHLRPRAEDFGDAGEIDPRLLPLKQLRAKLSGDKE
jgi:uncharacterized protein